MTQNEELLVKLIHIRMNLEDFKFSTALKLLKDLMLEIQTQEANERRRKHLA